MNGQSSERFASGDEQLSAGGEGHGHGGRSSERFAAGDQQLAAGGEGRRGTYMGGEPGKLRLSKPVDKIGLDYVS